MRKENSTNAINEQFLFQVCELNSAIAMISGRWKSQIVYSISQDNNRFHLIKKELPNISVNGHTLAFLQDLAETF